MSGPRVTYVPPPPSEDEESIFSHYESGANFDKYDEILVDVIGTNPPPAIMAAFLLPILQQLMADDASCFSEMQEPDAIIVAPTWRPGSLPMGHVCDLL